MDRDLIIQKQVIDTGVKFDTTDNWVFDGEYI